MEKNEKPKDFESLPLKLSYEFLNKKGFENESNDIRLSQEKYKAYKSTLRRGKIIDLMEKNNLFDEFIKLYWPFGKTESGKKKIKRYKSIFYAFTNQENNEEESEEENLDESSFAYEIELRNYLYKNLSVIEKGLKIFKDSKGIEGIEYSVDQDNKRIDILAIDKNNVPVVIELKVSRGHERVIGQCLYYRNRVKNILKTDKARIIIVAREISRQLKTAIEGINNVDLFEYSISFKLEKL